MSKDTIYRQDAVSEIHKYFCEEIDKTSHGTDEDGEDVYTDMQAVNSLLAYNKQLSKRIKALPSAQKACRWTNKGVFYGDDVDAWQECECSKCGRWDTRPYMYYFSEPNYCSYCGAKMQKGEQDG